MKRVLTAIAIVSLSACAFADDAITFVEGSGSQAWGGPLGIDFTPQENIFVTNLGAFDNTGQNFADPITVQIWNTANTAKPIYSVTIGPTSTVVLANGALYTNVKPIFLQAGQQYALVAYGFTGTEENYNTNTGSAAADHTLSTLGGLIAWDENSNGAILNEYGNTPGQFPTLNNEGANYGPNWQLPNASFTAVAAPGPAAAVPFALGALSRLRRRKKS